MRKDVYLSATVNQETAVILHRLAELETEGNRSLLLRKLIQEAGARRGLQMIAAGQDKPRPARAA